LTWTVSLTPASELSRLWPVVAPLLAPAVQRSGGRLDMSSVFQWLTEQRYLLWVAYGPDRVISAAFVTRGAVYPKRKMLVVELAGGSEMQSWVSEGTRVFRAYARDAGLDGVEMFGREGWTRALKAYGWKQAGVLCEVSAAGADRE
jgi:hypothetical protein